jgi:LMBR1 domain-containing protein 1
MSYIKVLSLSLSCYNVFLLPLDAANQGGNFNATGGIPMAELTLSFFIISVVFGIAIVPFTMYYYEGVDEGDDYGG